MSVLKASMPTNSVTLCAKAIQTSCQIEGLRDLPEADEHLVAAFDAANLCKG